ncbi:hypothetical protein [Dyella sp.]|uniref:TolB family protein n=1 Tax=Dyella sp. TaxID=1869338 RepID=UPI002ED1A780
MFVALRSLVRPSRILLTLSGLGLLAAAFAGQAACVANPGSQSDASFPKAFNGKLVYHSYVSYGDGTSQLFIYDFGARRLIQVSKASWGISDPMNASFSPDGKWLLFMGIKNNSWNVFLWPTDGSHLPYNLTNSKGDALNEDPKFSADGKSVVYKYNEGNVMRGSLVFANGVPSLKNLVNVTRNNAQNSMPFLSPDGSKLMFVKGSGGADLGLYQQDINTGAAVTFDATPGLSTYYPIVRADGVVFYTKWNNARQQHDLLYAKIGASDKPVELPINDCLSNNDDAAPVSGTSYVFFSSTTAGGYRLYLGDINSGKRWRMTQFGLDAEPNKAKLGASYYAGR